MGIWNIYFILKLVLLWDGVIGLHVMPNLAFALALAVRLRPRWARGLRQLCAIPLGIALFYYDSHLPPFARLLVQLPELEQFRFSYLLELLGRFIGGPELLGLVGLALAYWIVNRWLRVTSFVLLGLLLVPLGLRLSAMSSAPAVSAAAPLVAAAPAIGVPGPAAASADTFVSDDGDVPSAADPNAALAGFYQREHTRTVTFPAAAGAGPDFDIIVLHICSLAWDDLDATKLANLPLLSRFDFIFKNFNSAASYSGPAAIRVLRASCGQLPHKGLYDPAPDQCHLFYDLKQLGFTPNVLLNHDGHFDNFLGEVRDNLGVPGVQAADNSAAHVSMRAFDESPIRDDFDVLSNWYKQRVASPEKRVVLYYNTISLHDGNRIKGSKLSSVESFPLRVRTLFDDIGKFIDTIQRSGRKAVVVFVPEHGAAIRGNKLQISGMREIPLEQITHVPVGVKLVGFGNAPSSGLPLTIDKPVSYLALAQLIANLVADNPFQGQPDLSRYASGLPATAVVSENAQSTVMRYGGNALVRGADGVWLDLKTLE